MLNIDGIPAFEDNYIWLVMDEKRRYAAIVDPGDATPVLKALHVANIQPIAILITHHHGDHVGGIRELVQNYDIPVYGPADEKIPALTHPLREGDTVKLDEISAEFRVLDVPGHTAGHISYYGHRALFCGDTLFTAGCGRLFEGTAAQMHHSLEKIAALPDDTLIYCAHEYTLDNLRFAMVVEPDSTELQQRQAITQQRRNQNLPTVPSLLKEEKQTNPFLRCHVSSVIKAVENFAKRPLKDGTEVFAMVRHWKDTLD